MRGYSLQRGLPWLPPRLGSKHSRRDARPPPACEGTNRERLARQLKPQRRSLHGDRVPLGDEVAISLADTDVWLVGIVHVGMREEQAVEDSARVLQLLRAAHITKRPRPSSTPTACAPALA